MLYTYKPSLIKCYVFGVELVGLSKENFVTIERIGESVVMRKAPDGSTTAFIDNYASYRVRINVEQVSSANEFLHTIFKLHQRVGLNLKIPLRVAEDSAQGGTNFDSFDTFFEIEPNSEFSSESTSREWVFVCNNATYSLQGTSDSGFLTSALQSTIRLIELSESAGIDLTNIESLIGTGISQVEEKINALFP